MGNTHEAQMARIEADLLGKYKTVEDYRWGYTKDRGPDTWWIHYPSASGGNQSPVDIPLEDVQFDPDLSTDPLRINYVVPVSPDVVEGAEGQCLGLGAVRVNESSDEEEEEEEKNEEELETRTSSNQRLYNSGNTLCLEIRHNKSYITGGPLKDHRYVLRHIVMHWGESDNSGSEHLVNGRPHSAELQLVHWNDEYDSYEEAVKRDDGVSIISVFIKVAEAADNKGLLLLSKLTEDILYRDQKIKLTEDFDVKLLLPDDIEKYWSYRGSFTSPPCYETVTWILLVQPISVTTNTLNKFRQLRSYCENETRPDDEFEGQIMHNTRPVQPLGTRKVVTVDTVALRLHSLESSDRYVTESLSPHAMPFPELFDQKRRDELFQWIQ